MVGLLGLHPLWISFGPVLILNAIAIVSLITFGIRRRKRHYEAHDAARRHASKFLNTFLREWWVWLTDPIAHFFVKLGMTPSAVTFIGFLFSPLTAILFAYGHFGYAGWTMVFGASFDLFDGRVARLTGKETRSGAFFDSVMDRFSEGICFLGLAVYFRESWVLFFVIAGLIGSMLVSYTKARGEVVGVDCKGGSMQRPERIVYLGVSSQIQPAVTRFLMQFWQAPPPVVVIGAIVLIGIMTNATSLYRMVFIMNALDSQGRRECESIPQIMSKLTNAKGREELWEKARHDLQESVKKRNQR